MSSPGESTKQADSCWSSSPAFIRVGEFGIKDSWVDQLLELVGDLLDVARDRVGEFGDDRLVGELVDVVDRQRGFGVIVGGRACAEDLRGELVAAGMVGLDLVGGDRDFEVLFVGLEDGLGEGDVLGDAFEQLLLALGEIAVGVLAEIPGREDVVVGVARQSVFEPVAGGAFDRQFEFVGREIGAAHADHSSAFVTGLTGFSVDVLIS